MRSIAGIPLRIGPGAIFFAAILTFGLGSQWSVDSGSLGWLAAALVALGLSGSILVHELAHALVARRYGIRPKRIALALFGGITEMDREASNPTEQIRIAAAGPAASIGLGVVAGLLAVGAAAASLGSLTVLALTWLAGINVFVGASNLLPGLPLDGGHILTGILWRRSGDRSKAVVGASRAGQVLGSAIIAIGLFQILSGIGGSGLWTAAIGFVIRQSARAAGAVEVKRSSLKTATSGLSVGQVIDRNVFVIGETASVAAVTAFLLPHVKWVVLTDTEGVARSVVSADRIRQMADRWGTQPVTSIATEIQQVQAAFESEPLDEVIDRTRQFPIVVIDAQWRPQGVVAMPSPLSTFANTQP